jgi:hypothetical protein
MERQGKLRIAPYFDNRGFKPASGVELIFSDGKHALHNSKAT